MGNTLKEESLSPVADVERSSGPFRVLTLDGGGIRGVYTASFLHGLAAHFLPKQEDGWDIGPYFNLIAGTSTGGILACGLAAGMPTSQILRVMESLGPLIFTNPRPDGGLKLYFWGATCLGKPANSSAPLRSALEEAFGTRTIGEVYEDRQIALCIPTSRLLDWSPKVFKSPHFEHFTRDKQVSLVDACMATSAVPILLPVASINEADHAAVPGNFVDGALWANNPALIGLLEALDLCTDSETGEIVRPIEILSIGAAGGAPGDVLENRLNRGLLDWGFGAGTAALSVELQDHATEYVMGKLVNHFRNRGVAIRYQRIPNPHVSHLQARELRMDRANPAAIKLLNQLGDKQAQFVQSECTKKSPMGQLITDIFSKTKAIPGQREGSRDQA
jgi:uncharacterized protein